MKHLFLLTPLTFAVLLLTGCPDTKLPTPAPKVPEPKVEAAMLDRPSGSAALNWNFDEVQAARHS